MVFISGSEVRGQVRSVLSSEHFNIEIVRSEQMRGFREQLLLRENIVWLFEQQQVSSYKWKFLSWRSRIGLDYISDVHLSEGLTFQKEKKNVWMKLYYLQERECSECYWRLTTWRWRLFVIIIIFLSF